MLVFPTGKMGRSAYVRLDALRGDDVSRMPATKVTQGANDLYIIANVPEEDLVGVITRAQMEDFLYKKTDLSARPVDGLPMARVYRNQIIGSGTETDPFEFEPNIGGATPFKPVSNFSVDNLKVSDAIGKVGLVRSCAKVSVTLRGEGVNDVTSVECYHAADRYTFAELSKSATYELKGTPITVPMAPQTSSPNTRHGCIYVPERLFPNSMPTWSAANTDKIMYVKIQTRAGRELSIPIVHNAMDVIDTESTYLDFATGVKSGKGGAKPAYNVIRNMHYSLNINVSADAQKIDVSLKVMPWTLVLSEFSYARPKYSIRVSTPREPNLPFTRLGEDINLHNGEKATITFTIEEPKGALWTASLTNALHYDLTGQKSGIVERTNSPRTYTMYIEPKAQFDNTPRYTQFFITINGEEIYLGDLTSVSDADGKGRFMNEVPGAKRWQFKLVE